VELTVHDLAALVGGQMLSIPDPSTAISGATSIAEARPGDVTFFGNPKYLAALRQCKATAVLVPEDFSEPIPAIAIRCANPTLAFTKVLEKISPPPIVHPPGIHPTAVISPGATIGQAVSIQPHAVIEPGAQIGHGSFIGAGSYIGHEARVGERCHIAPRVTIGTRCIVGNRVLLHSGVVLGSDGFGFEFTNGRHEKIPQTGIVQIDDDVEIGANTTVDRARFGRTWIGEGTKIDNLVQIAHNVQIGKHCILCAQVGISGSTRLADHVVLGGQVGTVGHIEIASGVQVGAQSGVSKNIPPGETWFGTPAQPMHSAKEQFARVALLPRFFDRLKAVEQLAREIEKSLQSGTK
jgi:UDP-3-O-[3-hydroxymyristoyl] glucosamine N-acyltransferase